MLIVMVTGSPERGGISGLFRGGGLEGGGGDEGSGTVADPMFLFQAGQKSRAWMLLFQTALNIVFIILKTFCIVFHCKKKNNRVVNSYFVHFI